MFVVYLTSVFTEFLSYYPPFIFFIPTRLGFPLGCVEIHEDPEDVLKDGPYLDMFPSIFLHIQSLPT